MALFVITWLDKTDGLQTRMAAREAHLAYIAKQGDAVRMGGPYLSAGDQMIGSMILYEAETLAQAEAFHAADPYKLAGLFERSWVRPWRMTVGSGMPAKS